METSRVNKLDVELLREVVEFIKADPKGYDQTDFGRTLTEATKSPVSVTCETPCCAGGIILILRKRNLERYENAAQEATKLLGISESSGEDLLGASWPSYWFTRGQTNRHQDDWQDYFDPTPEEAIKILSGMAEDGYIWPVLPILPEKA